MNQKLWSSLTATALIITTLGTMAPGYASQPTPDDDVSDTNVSQDQPEGVPAVPVPAQMDTTAETIGIPESLSNQVATMPTSTNVAPAPLDEVSKVGEYQSQESVNVEESIATIYPHSLRGRQAATLYVRNIPVLTFLGTHSAAEATATPTPAASNAGVKVGSTQDATHEEVGSSVTRGRVSPLTSTSIPTDVVSQATAIAARVNQLYLNRFNAETLTVRWDRNQQKYVIMAGNDELVAMNSDLILPDTTNDPARDALQAANRLRRLLGNAPPLEDVEGRPTLQQRSTESVPQGILDSIRARLTGMASWYGPGFHGSRSANGEVFNQHSLTAAHRSLPFGTQVRVTNLDTGLSVVVRITDRGPFSSGRIIDLSAGAARVIGLINSGVAPVRLDVLGSARTASN